MKIEPKTWTNLFTILIVIVGIVVFVLAIREAGYIGENLEPMGDLQEALEHNVTFLDNLTAPLYIKVHVSGLGVLCDYTGPNATSIRWDFGDGYGDNGAPAYHNYTKEGIYLLTMDVRLENATSIIEYKVLELDLHILTEVPIPGSSTKIPVMAVSLFFSGSMLLATSILMRCLDVWPETFLPWQRVTLGIVLLFCGFLAMGFFNPLVGAAVLLGV